MPPKPVPTPAILGPDAAQYEENAVHGVYEAIAPHFSRTRYKNWTNDRVQTQIQSGSIGRGRPWPLINTFLSSLPPGALGLDTGAGNGKYLPSVAAAGGVALALDRSQGLLSIAKGQVDGGAECVRADICDVPFREGLFDFAISVAAIHHLSTPERRAHSVQALLRSLRISSEPARFFIYVWAYEQGPESKRKMGSKAQAPEGQEGQVVQDFLVPWVVKPGPGQGKKEATKGGRGRGDNAQATEGVEKSDEAAPKEEEDKVYHRFYHLFVKGELRDLVERAAKEDGFALEPKSGHKFLRVINEGWEADNWWIEGVVSIAA